MRPPFTTLVTRLMLIISAKAVAALVLLLLPLLHSRHGELSLSVHCVRTQTGFTRRIASACTRP
jgi:hypothetical protein